MNPVAEPILNELELDAITELVNIGMSRAATALREMVEEEVFLSVPTIAMVSRAEAARLLREREIDKLVAVHQVFDGPFAGRALLIFPDAKSLELVRAITKGELPLEDIIELEHEALAETGNIILNGCLATIANMLECNLRMSLPEILRGDGQEFLALSPAPQPGDVVMFLYINFAVRERDIKGYIALLMDLPSLTALRDLLRKFIGRTMGEVEFTPDVRD